MTTDRVRPHGTVLSLGYNPGSTPRAHPVKSSHSEHGAGGLADAALWDGKNDHRRWDSPLTAVTS